MITMPYIDTSFILCLILKDPSWAYEPCKAMFEDIKNKKLSTAISTLTLFETIGILTKRERWKTERIIHEVSRIQNEIEPEILDFNDGKILKKIFSDWKIYKECGFFDCWHYSIMKEHGITDIYSIDPHFDTFPGISRVIGES